MCPHLGTYRTTTTLPRTARLQGLLGQETLASGETLDNRQRRLQAGHWTRMRTTTTQKMPPKRHHRNQKSRRRQGAPSALWMKTKIMIEEGCLYTHVIDSCCGCATLKRWYCYDTVEVNGNLEENRKRPSSGVVFDAATFANEVLVAVAIVEPADGGPLLDRAKQLNRVDRLGRE